MSIHALSLAMLALCVSPCTDVDCALQSISADSLRGHLSFIASDLLGGRDTPSPGLDIAAEYIPEVVKRADKKIKNVSGEIPPENASFGDIIYRSREMGKVVRFAQKVAPRNIEVLIEGESGTGKELFARAIHNSSPRSDNPFIVINCGAIPRDLVESEFFCHKKGAFTGATSDRAGYFEAANDHHPK